MIYFGTTCLHTYMYIVYIHVLTICQIWFSKISLQVYCMGTLFLCRNSDKYKDYMVTIGIVGDLSRILEDFGSDPEVVTEVFCVIACLADLGEHCSHAH